MSLLIERHTSEEMLRSLAAYLPTGDVFTSALIPNSNLNLLLEGLSQELLRAENFLFLYNSQFIPSETTVFIEEWESALGIPDDCFLINESDTNEQRRLNILVKLASLGVQTSADFENLAAILGFPDVRVLPGVGSDDDSIINGEFNTDSDWTKGTGWTIFAGTANHQIGAASDLSQDITAVTGTLYAVSYDVLFTDTGTVTPNVGGTDGITRSENGSYEEVIEAGSSDTLFSMIADASFNGSVDNVTVNGSLTAGSKPRFTIVVEFPASGTAEEFPLEFPIPFGNSTFTILQCLFTKLKPANCDIVFVFLQPIVFLHPLLSWGNNAVGQLAQDDTTNQSSPVQIGSDTDYAVISAGDRFGLVVKTDGTAFAWGDNDSGELGINNTTDQSLPVQIGSDMDWADVSGGDHHSIGLKTDNSAWGWGNNNAGQLGLGNFDTPVLSPVQIGSDLDWATISTGASYTLATKEDGSAYAWGLNGSGRLGLGDFAIRSLPTQIGSDMDWAILVCGTNHSLAIKTDGSAWGWGNNATGQLGNGTTAAENSPIQIGSDMDWAMISAGDGFSIGVKTDGSAYGWGANGSGELGLGDTMNRSSPVQIGSDMDWAIPGTGNDFTFIIKTDNTAFAWGRNINGRLGIDNEIPQSLPVQIGADENWSVIVAGSNFSIALLETT